MSYTNDRNTNTFRTNTTYRTSTANPEWFLERIYDNNSQQISALLEQLQNAIRTNNEINQYLSLLRRQSTSSPAPPAPAPAQQDTAINFSSRVYVRPLTLTAGATTNSTLDQYILQLAQQFLAPLTDEESPPTPEQIALATRQSLYQNIVQPLNTQCPIRLSNFNENDPVTMIRHCRHIFNTADLSTWFQTQYRCPVCRYDIRTYVATEEPVH